MFAKIFMAILMVSFKALKILAESEYLLLPELNNFLIFLF